MNDPRTASAERRRGQRRHPVRWRVEAAGLRASIRLLNALPESTALALGAFAGRRAARFRISHRRVALANMRVAFPDWSEERREDLLGANLDQLGRIAAQWARLPSLSPDELLEGVEFRGLTQFEAAFSGGRGALFATAHYGYWELILTALRYRAGERRVTAVGHAARNPYIRGLFAERRGLGEGEAPLAQDAGAILQALRRNAGVGVLVDQYLSPRRGGLLVPFLERRAWTNPGPATLARRTGSPILLVHTRPLSGRRHLIAFGPEIAPAQSGDRQRDIADITERINAAIGEWVREHPELWLWFNRRFRGSPDVDRDAYER